MGLFDGRIEEPFRVPATGSTGQAAQLLGAPVVMVVDGRGQSQSMPLCCMGFRHSTMVFASGVILNRVRLRAPRAGSAPGVRRSECRCWVRCRAADDLAVPSRHLGLVTATEHGDRAWRRWRR